MTCSGRVLTDGGVEWMQVCCQMMDKGCFWKLSVYSEQTIQNWSGHRESDCVDEAELAVTSRDTTRLEHLRDVMANVHMRNSFELFIFF